MKTASCYRHKLDLMKMNSKIKVKRGPRRERVRGKKKRKTKPAQEFLRHKDLKKA